MGKGKSWVVMVLTAVVAVALVWWCLDAFGVQAPLFAFLANWIVLSWVVLIGGDLRIPLPASYYAAHPFETSGRVYELLGVRLFKAVVRRGPLAMLSPTLRFPKERTAEGIRRLRAEMCTAEAGHLLALAIVVIPTIAVALLGEVRAAAWLLLFTIPINVYPILLQRYNRIKLDELLAR